MIHATADYRVRWPLYDEPTIIQAPDGFAERSAIALTSAKRV
jgi:hypothetical protein